MASHTLNTAASEREPIDTIYDLATELQTDCERVKSLAYAIDEVSDLAFPTDNEHVQKVLLHVTNFAQLIGQVAGKAREQGEQIERLAMRLRSDQRKQASAA